MLNIKRPVRPVKHISEEMMIAKKSDVLDLRIDVSICSHDSGDERSSTDTTNPLYDRHVNHDRRMNRLLEFMKEQGGSRKSGCRKVITFKEKYVSLG